jgi:CheY-like chemotaxis protein
VRLYFISGVTWITTIMDKKNQDGHFGRQSLPAVASELNNLLQIISSTVVMLENGWERVPASEKYFDMLRKSVDRAAKVTAQLVQNVGGTDKKILLHPALAERVEAPPVPASPLQVARCVLVVDDEPMALVLLQQILAQAGFAVVSAQSGFEAIDFYRKEPGRFALVLLDLAMPLMDGEETFNRLRAIDPAVVVLLNTGFIENLRLDRMMANGLAGFLRRPYRPAEVITQIESVLESIKKGGTQKAADPRVASSWRP